MCRAAGKVGAGELKAGVPSICVQSLDENAVAQLHCVQTRNQMGRR